MKNYYSLLFSIFFIYSAFGQTTVSYDFADGSAVNGLNEATPGITLDSNIGFGSFRNSGTSNPGIFSGELRLYQNTTKGGSIKVYPSNGVTITDLTFNTSRSGPAEYSVDGGSPVSLAAVGGVYTISGISGSSEVEFWCVGSNSSTRIYVDDFDVTYSSGGASTPTVSFDAVTSSENETDMTFNTSIPVSMTNYDMPVTVSVIVDAASTAQASDYVLNTSSLMFSADETLNISLDINDDADFMDETVILNIAVTSGTADLGTSQHTVTILDNESPPAPTLIITEISDPNDIANARFVEIYNNGTEAIDFSSTPIYISRFVNNATTASSGNTESLTSGILEADNYLVIAASGTNFSATYGFSPDEINGGFAVNGDDPFGMYLGTFPSGTLFDVYGEIGVDGTGEDWEYENSRVVRNNINDSPSTTWIASNWTISSANAADATPGASENEFRYDGDWKPSDPNSNASLTDDLLILEGNAVINSNISVNDVTVTEGAGLTVNSGVTLTANTLDLESNSTQYASLILDGDVSGDVAYHRFINANANGNDLVAPPLHGESWNDFINPINNDNASLLLSQGSSPTLYAFGPFDKDAIPTSDYINYNDNTSTTLESGVGYRAATVAGSNLTFTGIPQKGTIGVTIEESGNAFEEWNLIGNPYTSYISAFDFLSHNINNNAVLDMTSGAIYGYNAQTMNKWDIINLSAVSFPNEDILIAPGQGFFVASGVPSGTVEFTTAGNPAMPDMRRINGGDDFIANRNANPSVNYNLELRLSNANENFVTDFYFNDMATLGLDPGYDSKLFGNTAPAFSLYSHLVNEDTGVNMGIQSLGASDFNDVVIPLGIHTNQGEQINISISQNTLPAGVDIYLEDTIANTNTLLNSGDYVLTPNVALTGTGRFFLRLSNSALSIGDNKLDDLSIYTDQANRSVIISGEIEENTVAKVYDIQGRLIETKPLDHNLRQQNIALQDIQTGVYIVALSNNIESYTQKIILK